MAQQTVSLTLSGPLSIVHTLDGASVAALKGASSQCIFTGNYNNPNGYVTPAVVSGPGIYYKDQTGPIQLWFWSPSTLTWFPVITV